MAAWTELPPTGGLPECAALVQIAERLRWSAAELVIQYAQRALAESDAEGGPLAVRAQALVAAALVRLGRHADAVEPAVAALRGADEAGVPELVPAVRLDLAACAHGLGESLLGCSILRPVLENTGARPSTKALAIMALVGCTAHVGRRDDLEDSLAEAERLLAADDALSPDARRMERAQLAMRTAAYYRRYGETEDAVDAARTGLGQLAKLRDPRLEGGLAKAGLTLELVCALLDDGELAEAERVAGPLLAEPVRSASSAAVGRLMLAMVTRVHLPAGRVELARGMLGHATWIAERYEHDWLLGDAHTALAQLDEAAGQPVDALHAMRAARMAEQRQARQVDVARRQLMIEFGARPMTLEAVNSLLRNVVRAQVGVAPAPSAPAMLPPVRTPATVTQPVAKPEPAETEEATGLLTREGLSQRLRAARSSNRPLALTLVRLEPVDGESRSGTDQDAAAADPAPDALATLAGRVRDIAPEDAELARSDGSELAVLLPHTTRDEAEEFAATIRESAIESDWLTEASGQEVSLRTGVAQSGPAIGEDADSLLSAARETLTTAEAERPGPTVPEAPSSDDLFLSTLEQAAGDPSAGYQEIRALLAPLLGHPSLKRGPETEPTPAEPEPEERPDPEAELPGLNRPEEREEPGPAWQETEVARRHVVPGEPEEPEPDDIPEPPRRPGRVSPKDPDPFPITPDEPDSIPPVAPGPEPTPDVPPPTEIPATPKPEPKPQPEPEPERPPSEPGEPGEQQPPEESQLDAVLGPVQGPEPRPDDLPRRPDRPLRRPERSDTTSIAELLTEALVAYQETTPDEDPPTDPAMKPVVYEPTYYEATPSGRHRMPDWDNGV